MSNSRLGQELDLINQRVVEMFALVRAAIPAATHALLTDDRDAARTIIERDQLINDLHMEIEQQLQRCLTIQAPLASDLRQILSLLRIVPELERSGDLAAHVARRATRKLGSAMTPRLRGLFEQAGTVAERLWLSAEEMQRTHDASKAENLRADDNELDELHGAMIAEAIEADLPTSVAMEVALIARFYERLGDHAVNIANRMRYAGGNSGAQG